jgi:hypothetical protein
MATIVKRLGENGQVNYRVRVRRKGASPLSGTYTKLSDARMWIQVTEAAILEGRHSPPPKKTLVHQEANSATLVVEKPA